MGHGKGRTPVRRGGTKAERITERVVPQTVQIYNDDRRSRYHTDPEFADRARKASRDNHRKNNPLPPSRIADGLLFEGQLREVFSDEMDHPVSVISYTVPEAARALGRSELTFRKWLADDLVPEPILKDTARGYRIYSVGELQSIANILAAHEREFQYYSTKHETTKHRIFQQVQAYRSRSI